MKNITTSEYFKKEIWAVCPIVEYFVQDLDYDDVIDKRAIKRVEFRKAEIDIKFLETKIHGPYNQNLVEAFNVILTLDGIFEDWVRYELRFGDVCSYYELVA